MYNFLTAIGTACQEGFKLSTSKVAIALLAAAGIAGANTIPIEAAQAQSSLANGTYLYGQSETAETIGSEYLVFEVRDGSIKGAFYMPRSEFACFTGNLGSRNLNLSVKDIEDGQSYNHQIALAAESPVADNSGVVAMGLQGFHLLETPSENDLRILNTCRAQ